MTGGSISVIMNGPGTVIFAGPEVYSGATTVNGGTLEAGSAGAFSQNSTTTVNSGGTLDLGGYAQSINSVTVTGGTIQDGTLTTQNGSPLNMQGGQIGDSGGVTSFKLKGGLSVSGPSETTSVDGHAEFDGTVTVASTSTLSVAANGSSACRTRSSPIPGRS